MKAMAFALLVAILPVFVSGTAVSQSDCIAGIVYFGDVRVQNVRVKLVSPGQELITFTDLRGIYELCSEPGQYQLVADWQDKTATEPIELLGVKRQDIILH